MTPPRHCDLSFAAFADSWLESDCGRNILGVYTPQFIGVPAVEFFQVIPCATQPVLPPALRPMRDAGQFFPTLKIAAKLRPPLLPNFAAQVPDGLPAPLQYDTEVSSQEWPMRIKPAPAIEGTVVRPLTT